MSERRPFIAANWKLHKTQAEAREFAKNLVAGLAAEGPEVVVAPSHTLLHACADAFAGTSVVVAGQDVSAHDSGAFTGEVSGAQLRDVGCGATLIGHSERRQYHGETDAIVGAKLVAAIRHGLVPVVCVGETLVEREGGSTETVVLRQLEGALAGIDVAALASLVIAYEPVWAIGTGRNATPEDAQLVHRTIRSALSSRDATLGARTRILYGGSVKPDNAAALLGQPDVDGALVGGASLDADSFLRIVRAAPSRA